MSGLTPESARAAAAWLEKRDASVWLEGQRLGTGWWVRDLRAEADRLEAAAKTPGQVLAEASGFYWADLDQYAMDKYADRAAAVIAHHVGSDRVVVDRADLSTLLYGFDHPNETALGSRPFKRIREALS